MSDPDQPSQAPEDALATIEELEMKKAEKLQDEMEEYTEMRKVEREKQAEEIEELKRKRVERIKERAEEEKRMAVQRKEEDARRKAEEEERKKKKAEEEEKRKIERERRRREAEKRKTPKKPNFTIVKREGGEEVIVEEEGDESSRPPQKSKELLEKEKQAALAQRVAPLAAMEDFSTEQLEEAARELHNQIRNLISHEYDMEEKYKRMQYDIVELQERTRAMTKTKKRGGTAVQYDDSYDRMTDKFQNAPPKILVANKYEGNLDRRSWKEKVDCYNKKEDLVDINKQYSDYVEINIDNLYFAGGL